MSAVCQLQEQTAVIGRDYGVKTVFVFFSFELNRVGQMIDLPLGRTNDNCRTNDWLDKLVIIPRVGHDCATE